jgi:hypothetical protein
MREVRMALDRSIEEYDIVVKRAAEGGYVIAQHLEGRDEVLEPGPFNAGDAQARAIELAHAHGADAWLEEQLGNVRHLK